MMIYFIWGIKALLLDVNKETTFVIKSEVLCGIVISAFICAKKLTRLSQAEANIHIYDVIFNCKICNKANIDVQCNLKIIFR